VSTPERPELKEGAVLPFTVVAATRGGHLRLIERDGQVWEPIHTKAKAEERRADERRYRLREQIEALAGDREEEARRLFTEYDIASGSEQGDRLDELFRQIGFFIVGYGVPHLWQALYLQHYRYYGLCPEGDYSPNAEWRFLFEDAWRMVLERHGIAPTPEVQP